jgi:hypothetical protein
MSSRRVSHLVSDAAETVTPFAANTPNSVPRRKILLLAALSALLVIAAVPALFWVNRPAVAAHSTLKCYDSAGNHEPCLTQAGASQSRFNGRTTEAQQPANWTTAALEQSESWTASAADQPASLTTSAPAARNGHTPRRRPASAICGRRLLPCFFSALRKEITHIAYVAAKVGARPAREHL